MKRWNHSLADKEAARLVATDNHRQKDFAVETTLTILIADDQPEVRRVVRDLLEAEGWRVCAEAANGREAVELSTIAQPDVIVLDLSMPELSGLEAARRILGKRPRATVLLFTLHVDEELVLAAHNIGVHECIVKTDPMRLIAVVGSIQHRRSR